MGEGDYLNILGGVLFFVFGMGLSGLIVDGGDGAIYSMLFAIFLIVVFVLLIKIGDYLDNDKKKD